MTSKLPNPERLLTALDQGLDHEVRLILYGRSAVWLGFENPPVAAAATSDVDAIIPDDEVQALADDLQFWDARDAVNERFKSDGLYITHQFCKRLGVWGSGPWHSKRWPFNEAYIIRPVRSQVSRWRVKSNSRMRSLQ